MIFLLKNGTLGKTPHTHDKIISGFIYSFILWKSEISYLHFFILFVFKCWVGKPQANKANGRDSTMLKSCSTSTNSRHSDSRHSAGLCNLLFETAGRIGKSSTQRFNSFQAATQCAGHFAPRLHSDGDGPMRSHIPFQTDIAINFWLKHLRLRF